MVSLSRFFFSFSFSSSFLYLFYALSFVLCPLLFLSLSLSRSLPVAPLSRGYAPVCVGRACVRARAPGECVELAVPKEPREYVSILEGVTGGAETAPALATVLLGTTSRSSNPRCNPNERCSPFPYPFIHPLVSPVSHLSAWFISSSLHRNVDHAPDQLKRSTITWFSTASAASSFSSPALLVSSRPLPCPFPLASSPLSLLLVPPSLLTISCFLLSPMSFSSLSFSLLSLYLLIFFRYFLHLVWYLYLNTRLSKLFISKFCS